MKASCRKNEPKQLAEWEEASSTSAFRRRARGRRFTCCTTGRRIRRATIHLGTGLNKILKDMVVKSKTMAGFRAPYVPGWDCHGLPIETQVEKELGGKRARVAPAEFRRMCREFASRYVDQHRRDFKRLGVLGRWEEPYLTMDPQYEATIAGRVSDVSEKGYVYRGLKPVYWCIARSHGAGRSGSGVRRSHQPVDLGEVCGAGIGGRSRGIRQADVAR